MKTYSLEEFVENKIEIFAMGNDFEVVGLSGRMNEAVVVLEAAIEARGNTVRIYTAGRLGTTAASALLMPWAAIAGIATVALHNALTFNPNFEIAKHLVDNKLTVVRIR